MVRVYMVLGDAVSKLETFVWILNHISRSITNGLCLPYKHHTWSNDQSQHDLSCGDVSLSISLSLKLAPVP